MGKGILFLSLLSLPFSFLAKSIRLPSGGDMAFKFDLPMRGRVEREAAQMTARWALTIR